jgi:hypothetical protein
MDGVLSVGAGLFRSSLISAHICEPALTTIAMEYFLLGNLLEIPNLQQLAVVVEISGKFPPSLRQLYAY